MPSSLEKREESTDSIEITRSAKEGTYGYTTKVYFNGRITDPRKKLLKIDRWFRTTYLGRKR